MATYTEAVQKLYVAYFSRPADAAGLKYWEGVVAKANGDTSAVSAAFAASKEYKDTYAGKSEYAVVYAIYQNLFGREAEKDGVEYWGQLLMNKTYTIDNIVAKIAAGAQNDDAIAYKNKVAAATAFTNALDTSAKIIGYDGEKANLAAKAWMQGITNDGSLTVAIGASALNEAVSTVVNAGLDASGKSYNLTIGLDKLIGTDYNDTFNAGVDPTTGKHTLTGLDTIDGRGGVNTLNVTDPDGGLINMKLLSGMTNIQKLNVVSVGYVNGTDGADEFNVKQFAGLTDVSLSMEQGGDISVIAATNTNLTVSNDAGVTVKGGGGSAHITADGVVKVGKAAGFASADKNAFTNVSVVGGDTVDITDNSGASGAIGSTLTTVAVESATGATINLTGNKINNVSLTDIDGSVTSTVIANTGAHALALAVDGVTGKASITDTTATSVVLTAGAGTGVASNITLKAGAAKTLSVGGAGKVTLDNGAANYAALTNVTYNGSGSFTANLTGADHLTTIDASGAKGGATVTIAGTNNDGVAQSFTGGAGSDTITITGTLGKGSVLMLGGGSDVVKVSGAGLITGDAIVDAGDGIDTLSLSIVGDANVGAFKNFELFDVAGINKTFDEAVLDQKNSVQNFIGTDAVGGANAVIDNMGAGVGFIIKGNMGTTNALTLKQATAGAMTITSDVDQSKAAGAAQTTSAKFTTSNASSVNLVFDNNNVDKLADYANSATITMTGSAAKSLSIVSGGSEVVNKVNFTGAASSGNDLLTSVTVTGNQALVFDYLTGGGALKLASFDASGQTAGGVSFNLNDLTAAGTIKLGAGDDVLTAYVMDSSKATTANVQTINGMSKAADKGQATVKGFDTIQLNLGGATKAADVSATTGVTYSIKDGVYSFLDAGASSLADAVAKIAGNLANNATVVFTFAGSKYIYNAGADHAIFTDDVLVKITGTSDIHGLDVTGGSIYLF